MTARALLKLLRSFGCEVVRQKGSHARVRRGRCFTTVPVHAGEDLGPGLLRAIERDLEPCLGKGWMERRWQPMATKRIYKATVEMDEAGWWVGTVRALKGCHSQAKTLPTLRERLKEAIDVAGGAVASDVELELKLPGKATARVRAATEARARADEAGQAAQRLLREAARDLTAAGVGMRDAGELLGVSFQRVHQLVSE